MIINLREKKYLLFPVLLSLLLAIIVTLSNDWPLSWDVYTHINYALAYVHNGLTTIDPLLDAPNGKTIGYSPLFHFILIAFSQITHTDFVTTTRILQILFAGLTTLSVVYISYKCYDEISGIVSGMLLISSFMFTRLYLSIPETVAVILFMWGIYFYYTATLKGNTIRGLLVGVIGLLILAVHFSSFIYYVLLLTLLMIIQTVIQTNANGIKCYVLSLIPMILLGILAMYTFSSMFPTFYSQLIYGMTSILNDPYSLFMGQKAMGLERYISCIGIITLVCAMGGLLYSFKTRELLFISCWALVAFFVSNMHWIGIPVYTFRLLIYLIIPAVIIGGYGVTKAIESMGSKNLGFIILIIIMILCFVSGYLNTYDSSVLSTNVETNQSTVQIAPPSQEEAELINWFKTEDTGNKSVLINNLFAGTILSSVDDIPIHYQFDVYTNKTLSKSSGSYLNNESIGYIVYDKSLVLNNSSEYSTLDVRYIEGDYYPLYYFTQNINDTNFNQIQLSSTEKVYENSRFIVCKVIEY